jgi:hypothetical protein
MQNVQADSDNQDEGELQTTDELLDEMQRFADEFERNRHSKTILPFRERFTTIKRFDEPFWSAMIVPRFEVVYEGHGDEQWPSQWPSVSSKPEVLGDALLGVSQVKSVVTADTKETNAIKGTKP